MSADQLIQYLSWTVFVLIFVIVSIQAIRQPRRATIDIALLFCVTTLVIAISVATALGLTAPVGMFEFLVAACILAIPYLLLRLLDDLAVVPIRLRRIVEALLAIILVSIWLYPLNRPPWADAFLLLYLLSVLAYVVGASVRVTMRSRGVTRRRMTAVTLGSLSLVIEFSAIGLSLWFPSLMTLWHAMADVLGLAAGVSYFLGFAPPLWLRRAWQGPELRAFLGHAASLPRLPDTAAIIRELERGAAMSIGAPNASIGLWNEPAQTLRFNREGRIFDLPHATGGPASRAYHSQQPIFSPDTHYVNPTYVAANLNARASAVLVAPITAGSKRLGVLAVYAPRAPIFAEDDLALVKLLADQAAVILESRALIDEAARVRAIEETTRLKDDFLSAAAHDLKTPLTTLIARAQLLERRAIRDPSAPTDLASIQVLVKEGQRLKRLVLELLDARRAEQGQLVGTRVQVDITALAQEVCDRQGSEHQPCILDSSGPVIGLYDDIRIHQLLENLVENALKYSPASGEVRLRVWSEQGQAHLTVSDHGIGIPAADLPQIFDRFYRGANVDDRQFAGMGLGLFICRAIVEQHSGRIWVESQAGEGSTFHVALPLVSEGVAVYA